MKYGIATTMMPEYDPENPPMLGFYGRRLSGDPGNMHNLFWRY